MFSRLKVGEFKYFKIFPVEIKEMSICFKPMTSTDILNTHALATWRVLPSGVCNYITRAYTYKGRGKHTHTHTKKMATYLLFR